MVKRQIRVLIMLISIVSFTKLYAQDRPAYSLYNLYHPLYNPAAMGGFDQVNALLLFNYQLTGFDGAPMHFAGDVSLPLGRSNALLGIQAIHERIGVRNRTMGGASFAYRVKLNLKNYLSFGLSAMFQNLNINWSQLQNIDPNDPLMNQNQNQQLWAPDFRLGTYYFSDRVYAGFSVGNLFSFSGQGDMSVDINNIHFYLQSGVNIPVGLWKIQPSVLVKQVLGAPMQIDVNAQFMYNDVFGFGVSYRTLNTVLAQMSVNIAKQFRIAYGFNMGFGFRNNTQHTGHEVILMYTGLSSKKKVGVACPRF